MNLSIGLFTIQKNKRYWKNSKSKTACRWRTTHRRGAPARGRVL